MQVETYEIEEQGAGTEPEVESEAMALAEKLGLEGQLSLIAKPASGERQRFQYPEMTAQEREVYRAVFPATTDIKNYSGGIIPVRVLQVAAHALEFCDKVQVWHKHHHDPDPMLVGLIGKDYSPSKLFRLARWGDGLKDFSELLKEATEITREKLKGDLEGAIQEAQSKLASLDSIVAKKMRGENVFLHVSVNL